MRYDELRIEVGWSDAAGSYRVRFSWPGGDTTGRLDIPISAREVQEAYGNIYDANRGLQRGFSFDVLDPVQEVGSRLFQALFTDDEPRRQYAQLLARTEAQDSGLRLRLVMEGEELLSLPWEFLFDTFRQDFVALSSRSALVRQQGGGTDSLAAPPAVEPPLRVLVATADPGNRYGANGEVEMLQELQRDAAALLEVEVMVNPTAPALVQALSRRDYHVFHFAGHGGEARESLGPPAHQSLLLGEEGKSGARLGAASLRDALRKQSAARLVILNACQTDRLAAMLTRVVPATVGIRDFPTVQGCLSFSEGFYRGLLAGQPIEGAVAQGRQTVDSHSPGSREWGLPVFHLETQEGTLLMPPEVIQAMPLETGDTGDEQREVVRLWLDLEHRNLQKLQEQARSGARSTWSVQAQIQEVEEKIRRLEAKL